MTQIRFKKLLAKKEVANILNEVSRDISATVGIQDDQGNLLWGEIPENPSGKYPIAIGDEVLGWVVSIGEASSISSLLSYLAREELEKRQMASELLQKYQEINLLYNLSEKITASLDLSVVAQLVIGESKRLFKTTSASIMLLNEERKVLEIISAFGTAKELNSKLCFNLDEGIAGSVFKTGKGELINNASSDPRFVPGKNPVSSIMCVPLKIHERVIGVLNVSNEEPIDYTAEDLKILTTLASQAVSVIETAIRHKNQIKEVMARTELEKGRQIQRDFLPDQILQPPNWEISACFYPARQVAGDFYDVFWLPGDCVGLVIGDVCDKGVGAALFMALFRSLIRVFSGQTQLRGLSLVANDEGIGGMIDLQGTTDLDHINALKAVALTNNYIAQEHYQMSMFATLFFGVLNPKTGLLSYISGGHVPLFIVGSTGVKERLNSTGPPVGMMPDRKFKIQQVQLEPGDILIGYTDGVTEARAPGGEFFTLGRVRSLLEQPATSASDLLKRIQTNLFAYIDDAPQFDDITMLAVQRTPFK